MVDCTDLVGPKLEQILSCAEQALIECDREVALVHLAPGAQVAWDNCCEGGGQLWVRVIEVFPSGRPFPQRDTQQSCGVQTLGVRVGLGTIRCAHVMDDNGDPPTAEEMTSDALGTTADMSILLGAIQCCVSELSSIPLHKVEQWRPLGPQGGCVGGEWQFVIAADWCGCG